MSPYSILPFFAFVLNVVLSAWVGAQNRSAPINRAFLSFSLPMAAWALCEFVAWNSVPGPALIALYRVEAVFWIPIVLLILRFAYRLLKRPDDPFLWLCAAFAFAFIVLEFSTELLVTGATATATAYGNRAVYGPAQLPATLFSAGCVVVALYLILCRARSETVPLRRHPLVWVATGIAAALLITVTTEILGPFAFPHRSWIELGPSSTSFISVFTFVAVLRYRFLSLGVEGFAEGLFNALGEGVLITDERLVIRKANPAAERLFLRSPLENLDAGSLLPGLSKAPRHWETRLVPKENAPHRHLIVGISPFSAFGAHHWRFIFLVDNTAAVHARLALAESEKRFRETVDLVPTAIIEVDLEGNVKHANRTAFSMFGYDQEDFDRGLNGYRDIIRPEEHERARRNFADIVERRRTGANEYGLRRKDGTPLHGLLTSAPIWRDGRPVGLRSSISDITEIEGLRGAALRSQKLESLGTLAGGIAHDFNNILTGILGGVTLLKEHLKTPDTAECARVLDQVEKASARGTALARQLLTFSKGGSPVKAPQDPVELVRESAALALLGSPVVSEIEAPSDLPRVDGDRDQILQVFHNLFLNAVQAMPEGGTVRVRLEARELLPAGAPGAIPGRIIAFTIDDEGPGIPEEILPRIFDPYFTTKPAGTGLGLSTSHSIIQRHGGSLRASRAPGGGARFEIWLPVFCGNVSVPPAAPPQTHATRRARILIMDDDPLIVQLLSTMLTTMGHEVVATHRGDEAVAALEASPDFDLCILDLTIPGGMGGEETMQRLRALKPDLKALVSSGYSDAPILSDPGAYGFLGILPKPYSFRALQTKIAEALG